MDSLTLNVLLYSQPRDILLYSLVDPSLFSKQNWRLLCRKVLFSSWSDYKHISKNPRRRFVEIAYRKGLHHGPLYSEESRLLFSMFRREKAELTRLAQSLPREVVCNLVARLKAKKDRLFFQRELCILCESLSYTPDAMNILVAKAEEGQPLINYWPVLTRLLINGDEQSLVLCKQLAFPKSYPGEKLEKLILRGRGSNLHEWLQAYSFTRDHSMIEKLLKRVAPSLVKGYLREIAMNLLSTGNLVLFSKLEREYAPPVYFDQKVLSFDDKLHCLANYYYYTGDDRGLYNSLIEVLKEKQPLSKETNIIFEIELYEVADLLEREGVKNSLGKLFMIQ